MKILAFIRQRSFARYVMFDLAEAARRTGLTVKWLDLEGLLFANAGLAPDAKQALVDGVLDEIRAFDPDLVFSYGVEYLEPVFEAFLPSLRTPLHDLLRKPAAFFFFDFGYPFDRPVDDTTAAYVEALQAWDNVLFVWDETALATLQGLGITNVFRFPMAVNEVMFHQTVGAGGDGPASVVFVGGPTRERIEQLEAIADCGLTVYGYDNAGWQGSTRLASCYGGEVLERDRLRDIYTRFGVTINITRPHGPQSLNMRVFEAMACGSLMITDDRAQAHELFVEGREIVIYRSAADLRSKVEYFRSHHAERRAIAQAGMAAVRSRHTYALRLKDMAPVLRQCLIEHRAGAKLGEFAVTNPAKALRFATLLDEQKLVTHQQTNLKCLEAEVLLTLGDSRTAAARVDEALLANPQHRLARRMRDRLTQET